jgi:hypothetical protein
MADKGLNETKGKTYWKGWLRRFLTLLAPAFLMCFTVIFFGPLDIVNANQMYLTFSAASLIPSLGLVTVAGTLVLAAVLAFVPGKAHGVLLALLLGIAVLLYFQGSLLNGDLGTLDGSSFDWHDVASEAYRNILVWAVVLVALAVLGFLFPEGMRTAGFIACAALVVAQAIALATTWTPADNSTPNYQLSGDEQFVLSSDENIIVITLDQFNPLIFEEQLEADPHFKEVFKDFIYYDNMSSVYSFTFPSLCYLLTHTYFDTTVPTTEAVYNAWHSDLANNFYDTLHENGYKVNLFLEANYAALGAENMLGKADNIVEAGDLVVTKDFFEFVVDMSLYRYLPTMLKNDYCVSTGGILDLSSYEGVEKLRINYDFLSSLEEEGITLTDDHKVFNWYHMAGAHFPYVVDYDGYLCDEDDTDRDTALHGYLIMVEKFLDELKEAGVYDDATIIISADHGYFECFQAVGMVKMSGQTNDEFTVSSAPVAQEDIMPTILYALGEDYSDYGTTVFDWNEGDHRIRTTSVWGYMSSYPDVDWIGNIDQWDAEANGVERYNVFGVFHYDGDRETILAKERFWYYYGVADEIQPLYDSFY